MKKLADFLHATMVGAPIVIDKVVSLGLNNKIVGVFIFSLGLFAVYTLKYNLLTGKTGYLLNNDMKTYLLRRLMMWVGSLASSIIVAELIRLTGVVPGIAEESTKLVQIKADDSLISLFASGIFRNIMIVHAINQYLSNSHEVGRYLGVITSAVVSILCGLEHCIADILYIQMVRMWNSQIIVALIVIILGNILGGILIPTMTDINTKLKNE